ncbi:unnamed protein product [Rotaria sp. Silwood1]|nr:unnamed protein product [Rotaria sp. Silwood1]CAF1684071.1 unnamed protein product [Rotaria sp. Silwood1]
MEITKATLFTKRVTSFERKKPITPKLSISPQRKKTLTNKPLASSLKATEIVADCQVKEIPICLDNTTSPSLIDTHGSIRPRRIRIVQNFTLIWLDSSIDETDLDYTSSLDKLRRIVNIIHTFRDVQLCINFLQDMKDVKTFLIISDALGEIALPQIHSMSQLVAIYVFSTNPSKHEHWANKWGKVKGIFVHIDSIFDILKRDVQQCDRDLISISVTSRDLSRLDPSFMYTQLLKEVLIEMPHDDKEKIELAEFCRQQYLDNQYELQMINEFERDYHIHTSIWWYTRESFAYQMLNRALRVEDIEIIIKMRFFLRDLHRQIKELHSKTEYNGHFTVYRGQGMSIRDFQKIKNSENGLLAFNSFLSTSLSESISLGFARTALYNPDSVGILFRMTINPSVSSTPFANIDTIGFYNDLEKEVLFSMHTIFRIGQIKSIEDRLWCVELSSASEDDDQELKRLTEYVRKETQGKTAWHRIGKLLIKTGSFDKAEEVCEMLLRETSNYDRNELSLLYFQLAYVKRNKGNYDEALKFYQQSLEIRQNILSQNHPDLADTYTSIGLLHDNMGEYSKALDFYQKSLHIWKNIIPSNHSKLASIYNNIATIYMTIKEYSKALEYYEHSLKNEKKSLPLNYSNLTITSGNIGFMYKKLTQYTKALEFFHKALKTSQNVPNLSRPWLANIYNNIALLHKNMSDYSKALEFYHKMLEFQQGFITSKHPELGNTYCNIALMHYNMGEYSKALKFYFKALEMYQNNIPLHNLGFGIVYNQIGQVYEKMGEYAKAISFYQQAIEIGQKSLSKNDPCLQSWGRRLVTIQSKNI